MARNRKDRQETVDDSGELVQQDGKWYKRVSGKQAWSICGDVQIYSRNRASVTWIHRDEAPDVYRASHLVSAPWYWKNYDWFVEVEPNKEEYICPV